MREIKFRAKAKTGEWVEGLLFYGNKIVTVRTDNKSPFVEKGSANYYYTYYDVDIETLGQFTGLKDKNGKEIFEGDITDKFLNVKWNILHNGWGLFSGDSMKCEMLSEIYDKKGKLTNPYLNCEIIGNIHENENLLQ